MGFNSVFKGLSERKEEKKKRLNSVAEHEVICSTHVDEI
jgi:hypothetical protein